MTTTTLRLPVRSALIQAQPYPTHGVEVLASIRLDILADALGHMEHDDTDPGEKRMNADQCRDALLREMLGGWRWPELVLARIPAIMDMQDSYSEIRRQLTKADNELHRLRPLEMLAARVDAPILDQAIEKIRAQADEIATLRREMDEARATLSLVHSQLDRAWRNGTLPADVIPAETARRMIAELTTPTPGAQP